MLSEKKDIASYQFVRCTSWCVIHQSYLGKFDFLGDPGSIDSRCRIEMNHVTPRRSIETCRSDLAFPTTSILGTLIGDIQIVDIQIVCMLPPLFCLVDSGKDGSD